MRMRHLIKPTAALIPLIVLVLIAAQPFPASACSSQPPSSCNLNLPATGIPASMSLTISEYEACTSIDNNNSYLTATLSGVPTGYSITNSPPTYNGWCVDLKGLIDQNAWGALPYSVILYSSLAAPSNLQYLPLNKINYILNVDTLISTWTAPAAPPTWLDKQAAIWSLLYSDCQFDNGFFVCPNEGRSYPSSTFPYGPSGAGCPNVVNPNTVSAILADANTYGANFTPGPGQKVAVIMDPNPADFLSTQCDPNNTTYNSYCEAYVTSPATPIQITVIEARCPGQKCIQIDKLVSVDGGKTFEKAEDSCNAPVATNDSAQYELVVKNCGDVDLANVEVTDTPLGISYNIPYLSANQSTTLTSGQIPQLAVSAVACGTSNLFQNMARVTGMSVADGTTVSASDSAYVKCPPSPPPPTCTANTTDTSKFSSTTVSSGSYIWFNANLTASGIPSEGTTITFSASTISFTDSKNNAYNLTVPNGQIIFSSNAQCPSTTFDAQGNTWTTTVPISTSGEIFLTGLSFPVPPGFGGQVPGNVVWSGNFGAQSCISVNWKWGAAMYSKFSASYNTLEVKPTDGNCPYNNSDFAGTPEYYKTSFTGGLTAGCGSGCGNGCGSGCGNCCGVSNYTGSWSCPASPNFVCQCSCSGQGSGQCGSQCQSGCGGWGFSQQGWSGNGQCGSQCNFGWGGKGCTLQPPSWNGQWGPQCQSGAPSCTWKCSSGNGQCGSQQSWSDWGWGS